MGNQQSNEKTSSKKIVCTKPKVKEGAELSHYEVIKKEAYSNFIRFYFNNYVTYKDGNYKYMDCVNRYPFNENEAELIFQKLDLNYMRNHGHIKTFGIKEVWDIIGMTEPIMKVLDVSETNLNQDGNVLKETLEYFGELGEDRQKFTAWVEQSSYANHSWTKQTSWDMSPPPPK